MQVDIRVPVGLPIPEVADVIARCEDAGFDGVGVHDHPHSGRDAYVVLALAAERTRRIRLYPATSSPVVRHPVLLASLAHSLDEIAPGRVCLTVAPGFLSARSVGRPPATVAAMREAVVGLRRLLAGELVAFGDPPSRLRNLGPSPPPVYLLAAGPRMAELAGEVADGAFLMVGLHRDAVAAARRHLEAGARRAARSLDGFRTVFIATIAVEDDLAAARRWPREWFAPGLPWLSYPSASNLYWLRQAGLPIPDAPTPDAIPESLVARIADAFGLFGPAELCAERLLRAREEAGVDHVYLFPAHTLAGGYDMPLREIDAFRRVIRPLLGR
ncbi:MAG TPA: LLM class flavin-dependent oxidoreductase [Methylomirabilota bacterium]